MIFGQKAECIDCMQLDFKVLFKVFDILSNGCIEGDDHFDHIIVEFLLVSLERNNCFSSIFQYSG